MATPLVVLVRRVDVGVLGGLARSVQRVLRPGRQVSGRLVVVVPCVHVGVVRGADAVVLLVHCSAHWSSSTQRGSGAPAGGCLMGPLWHSTSSTGRHPSEERRCL